MKRARTDGVNLDNAVAKRILDDCIKAGDISIEKVMKYSKSRHGQGPCWEEILASRHALGDVLVHSKGRLLRMVAWENQVRDFVPRARGQAE